MKVIIEKRYWCKCGKAYHPHTFNVRNKSLHGQGNLSHYLPNYQSFCCEDMEIAISDGHIKLGEYEHGMNGIDDKEMNIFHCLPFPEGACWDKMQIKFCPFCGEKIEICEEDNTGEMLKC